MAAILHQWFCSFFSLSLFMYLCYPWVSPRLFRICQCFWEPTSLQCGTWLNHSCRFFPLNGYFSVHCFVEKKGSTVIIWKEFTFVQGKDLTCLSLSEASGAFGHDACLPKGTQIHFLLLSFDGADWILLTWRWQFCFSYYCQKSSLRKWVLPSVLIKLRFVVALIPSGNDLQIFCVHQGKKRLKM